MKMVNSPAKMLSAFLLLLVSVESYAQQQVKADNNPFMGYSNLEKLFKKPGDAVQTSVYWYWISGNISKEGVIKDLQSMKKAGINRAFIGNIEQADVAAGKIKFFSDEWWDIMHTALKTATQLNIEIGIFNSPGWSQSGGPWIKQQQSMRYLACTETAVTGGQRIRLRLPKANEKFQDVRVIAFPAPKDYYASVNDTGIHLSTPSSIKNIEALMDKDTSTEVAIPLDSSVIINIEAANNFTARSIVLYPSQRPIIANVQVQVNSADGFTTIKEFTSDRSNSALNVGFDPYARVAVALPATTAKSFRLIISNLKSNYARSWGGAPQATAGIKELQLLSAPKVENYIEKSLAKMSQTPFPLWGQYLWKEQATSAAKDVAIDPSAVIDISKMMSADGELDWNAPPGQWIIVRSGMVPTGVTNSPAPAAGTGPEVDKMNKDHLQGHFDNYIGQILQRIPAADRKTFKVVVEDSYETGGQNWTDGMIEKFKAVYGYDPAPYIPVFYGSVVGSEEMSNRFLWDVRRFVADRVSFDYVGGLRDISHKNGLTTWLENYGHWGFPGEFLQYGGQSDEIGGEFWSEGDLGNIENRAASSSAHIYGKTKVSAESFTCGGAAFSRYPARMKQRGDRFFTEGINNTLLHVYIEQPDAGKVPGVNAGFGNEFNRNNTWFGNLNVFTDYLKRCNLMLQQGRYVADVAYFIGEDAPKMTGVCNPVLPKGYSFDYINADVLKQRITVKDDMLVLPNGITYRMLVLPSLKTMRPELLAKLQQLVKEGAVIYGPAPEQSPSLQNFPGADKQVKQMAATLWGGAGKSDKAICHYGKGMLITDMDLQDALLKAGAVADCKIMGDDSVLFIHRKINADDVYFLSNQKERTISFDAIFSVKGKQPELWDAVSGTTRLLRAFTPGAYFTTVPLTLYANGSAFIIFRNKSLAADTIHAATNFPQQQTMLQINTPWQVQFDTARWGPAQPVVFNTLEDWAKNSDDKIKYYSGTAVYQNHFTMAGLKNNENIVLDLGKLSAMATIQINGMDAGAVWTAPYSIDITDKIKAGSNSVAITVVNTWVNRLIGDLQLPQQDRKTWVNINPYHKKSALQPSGLLGPVEIKSVRYK